MNYKQSLRYLNSFVNYEKTPPKSHAELNLQRMRFALEQLDHPENVFVPILIAGTVGKGSTGYFLEQILVSSGTKTGYYHSPHVDHIRERIRVQGKMVSEKIWTCALTWIESKLRRVKMSAQLGNFTYFEMLTLLAIKIFADADVQAGIFEIGMGGRLDATNILEAPVCILTKIDFDHEQYLGKSLAAIAKEKAGIIKNAAFVISSPQNPQVMSVFKKTVLKRSAPGGFRQFVIAQPTSFQPGLAGEFQKQNAGNAAAAANLLKDYFMLPVTGAMIRRSLRANQWPGRMESLHCRGRKVLLDAAHNPAGCRALAAFLITQKAKPAFILFSALRDKNSREMLQALSVPKAALGVSAVKNPRSKTAEDLAADAKRLFGKISKYEDSQTAWQAAMDATRPGDLIIVTGSFYLLSEIRKHIKTA